MWSDLSTYSVCLLQSCTVASFTALWCLLQKLPSNECMFINMLILRVSLHTIAVKLLLILVFVIPLQFQCISKILQHPFSIWSNSPTAAAVLENFVCGMFWCFMHMYWCLYAWAVHTWLEACWWYVAGLSVGDVVSKCRLNHYCSLWTVRV